MKIAAETAAFTPEDHLVLVDVDVPAIREFLRPSATVTGLHPVPVRAAQRTWDAIGPSLPSHRTLGAALSNCLSEQCGCERETHARNVSQFSAQVAALGHGTAGWVRVDRTMKPRVWDLRTTIAAAILSTTCGQRPVTYVFDPATAELEVRCALHVETWLAMGPHQRTLRSMCDTEEEFQVMLGWPEPVAETATLLASAGAHWRFGHRTGGAHSMGVLDAIMRPLGADERVHGYLRQLLPGHSGDPRDLVDAVLLATTR